MYVDLDLVLCLETGKRVVFVQNSVLFRKHSVELDLN